MSSTEVLTLVAERRVVEVELDEEDRPRSLGVRVRIDGSTRWSSEEPGWRSLGCGTTAKTVYVWSARRLVALPLDERSKETVIDTDEDVIVAFPAGGGWLLVCETSVRLVVDGRESSRLEFADQITRTLWEGDRLWVECDGGSRVSVVVQGDVLLEQD